MLSNKYYNPYGELCLKEEELGRIVGEKCLDEFLNNYDHHLELTELRSSVDLKGSLLCKDGEIFFNVEIKQRNKTPEQLAKYPNVELRRDKLQRMMEQTPKGTELIYVVLLNESDCYIYNLKILDWSSMPRFDWNIRKIQVSSNSGYESYLTYQIPFSEAIAHLDCTKYFQELKNQNETL